LHDEVRHSPVRAAAERVFVPEHVEKSRFRFGFTAREIEVTRFLLQGSSYKIIAQRLGVSIDTVRSHIRRVYAKLRVHSVAEAANRVLGEKLG